MQKSFTLDQDTAFVDLYLSYDRQMGSVMYDGVQLYKEEAQAESSDSGPGTEEAHCTCAVSYTHLDVYKRQEG